MEDRHLITQVLRGNHQAFAALIDRHKGLVYSICLKVCKNAETAEEIAQDTFLKAFQKLDTFKSESKFSTWLYRIAYNLSLNTIKKSRIQTDDIDEHQSVGESDLPDGFFALKQEEQRGYLRQALDRLNERYALVLSLYYLEEMSVKEVAVIMTEKESNVKVHLNRARKALNKVLEDLLKDELKSIL
ncbi:RNA polymerase sigma factor [Reichenbachiella versicolor]|uniref:RNA polymerase sigma factor n=1 Tax=Reichenbachiella versicolor TaxID=1821036 RepID=UPI000D6E304B|nr:sigma-70 family RNA polymerase sigma factor [Reichenbachiella versicolor]